jgi:hypothetical protein
MDLPDGLLVRLSGALALLLGLFLVWLLSGWRGTPNPSTGKAVLRYSPPFRLAGAVTLALAFAFPLLAGSVLLAHPPLSFWEQAAAAGIGMAVALGGGYAGREVLWGHALVTDVGVEQISPWWGCRRLAWVQVVQVRHGDGYITLYGLEGACLHFPVYWTGHDLLLAHAVRHVGPDLVRPPATDGAAQP